MAPFAHYILQLIQFYTYMHASGCTSSCRQSTCHCKPANDYLRGDKEKEIWQVAYIPMTYYIIHNTSCSDIHSMWESLCEFCVAFLYLICTSGDEASKEAADMLTHNAKNLISAIEEVLYASERAIIKLSPSELERLKLSTFFMALYVYVHSHTVTGVYR